GGEGFLRGGEGFLRGGEGFLRGGEGCGDGFQGLDTTGEGLLAKNQKVFKNSDTSEVKDSDTVKDGKSDEFLKSLSKNGQNPSPSITTRDNPSSRTSEVRGGMSYQ